jgi:hypothetical protein
MTVDQPTRTMTALHSCPPSVADRVAEQRASRRGRAGPGTRGILGHVFWDELYLPSWTSSGRTGARCSTTGTPDRRGPCGRTAVRPLGRDVPVAERQRRARRPADPPEPEVSRWLPDHTRCSSPRQHRDRVQRLAALPGDGEMSASSALSAPSWCSRSRGTVRHRHYDAELDRYEIPA